MSATYEKVLAVLEKYVSRMTARGVLDLSLQHAGVRREQLAEQHLPRMLPRVRRGVRIFLDDRAYAVLHRELGGLEPAPAYVAPDVVSVTLERDISTARNLARGMCERMHASTLAVQKVATIVSELARNIVSYTPGGSVELIPSHQPRPRIVVRAVDRGDGISNLEAIMSGRYRSRTGLGKGLLGSKRLADRFDIQTGSSGTRIEVEIHL